MIEYTLGNDNNYLTLGEEIITAYGKGVKLSEAHIKELLEKGKKQNNKLCFADITDMIAALQDFTPKDYDKVMAEVNKAHIELVDKLTKKDIETGKAKCNNKKIAPVQSATEEVAAKAKPIMAQSHEDDIKSLTISTNDNSEEPTAEELSLISEDSTATDTEEIIEEAELEDYKDDDDREQDDRDEESYPEDGIIPSTYTDDPIRINRTLCQGHF